MKIIVDKEENSMSLKTTAGSTVVKKYKSADFYVYGKLLHTGKCIVMTQSDYKLLLFDNEMKTNVLYGFNWGQTYVIIPS